MEDGESQRRWEWKSRKMGRRQMDGVSRNEELNRRGQGRRKGRREVGYKEDVGKVERRGERC